MSADPVTFMRNILEEYKTDALPDGVEFPGDGIDLFTDLSEGFYYVSDEDKRRPPIIKIPMPQREVSDCEDENLRKPPTTDIAVPTIDNQSDASTALAFIPKIVFNSGPQDGSATIGESDAKKDRKYRLKMAYNHYYQELDPDGCLNDFEYLYHPLNYKVTQCAALTFCTRKYCPHYHSAAERELAAKLQEQIIRETNYQYNHLGQEGSTSPSVCAPNLHVTSKDGTGSSDSEIETGCSSVHEAKGLFVEFHLQVKLLKDITEDLEQEHALNQQELKKLQSLISENKKDTEATKGSGSQANSDQKGSKVADETGGSPIPDRETYQLSRITHPRFKNTANYPGKKNKLGKQLILNDFKPPQNATGSQQSTQYFMNQEVKSFEDINTEKVT